MQYSSQKFTVDTKEASANVEFIVLQASGHVPLWESSMYALRIIKIDETGYNGCYIHDINHIHVEVAVFEFPIDIISCLLSIALSADS